MATKHFLHLSNRLVFLRVGCCRLYNETPGDEPLRGGSWNNAEVGSESANHVVIEGRIYGFAKLGSARKMNARRVHGPSSQGNNDVAIALFATTPGGLG